MLNISIYVYDIYKQGYCVSAEKKIQMVIRR